MSNPIDTAAKGLAQSQAQLTSSAKRLAQSAVPSSAKFAFDPAQNKQTAGFSAPKEQAGEPKRSSTPERPSTRYSGAPLQGQGAYIPSMAEETVQMRMAANTYKANANLIQAAEDVLRMTQQALDPEKDGKAGR